MLIIVFTMLKIYEIRLALGNFGALLAKVYVPMKCYSMKSTRNRSVLTSIRVPQLSKNKSKMTIIH